MKSEDDIPLMVGHDQLLGLIALAKEIERKMTMTRRRRKYGLKTWEIKIEAMARKALTP